MSSLPQEWKAALEGLAPVEVVRRVEGLLAKSQTGPLPNDREFGPFLLFALGDSIDEVAAKTGIPVDVVYLTAISYRWMEKREELARKGNVQLIMALQRQLVNNLLVATQASVLKQVGEVMSGKLAPEKCSLIPRSLHGLKALMEMVSDINNLVAANEAAPNNTTVIHAVGQVQVNQGVLPPVPETTEEKRKRFLEMADKES